VIISLSAGIVLLLVFHITALWSFEQHACCAVLSTFLDLFMKCWKKLQVYLQTGIDFVCAMVSSKG